MSGLLDKQFLDDIGLQLGTEELMALSEQYEATLLERVTAEVVEELDETQLEQLRTYQTKDDDELQTWLKRNVPHLKEIVEDEVAILLGEIAENSTRL